MAVSNYKNLEQKQKQIRFKLVKITMYGLIALIVLVVISVLWITQPLLTTPKITQSEIKVDSEKLETHVRKLSEDI